MITSWIVESLRLFFMCLQSSWQFCYGIYHLSRLEGPIVSIFGGKFATNKIVIDSVYTFAGTCVREGFSILTGGGPGLMQAANCGAHDAAVKAGIKKKRTLGISVKGLDENFINPCANVVNLDQFFARKWLLIRYSSAFVVFPGGIGTTDEIYELLNLIKTGNLPAKPIILVGKDYWFELVDWFKNCVDHGYIKPQYRDLFTIVDDLDQVLYLIKQSCK